MIIKIPELLAKYKSIISYLFFGVCTTLINVLSYYVCFSTCGISNVPSTVIAWLVAVTFSFVTSKLFVFGSKAMRKRVLIYEMVTFFGFRLATGALDVAIMHLSVDVFAWNAMLWKTISNTIVIIFNYIASKLVIFRKR